MKSKPMNHMKKYFLVSPYVFSLSCVGLMGMASMSILCFYFIHASGSEPQTYYVIAFMVAVYFGACAYDAHEFFGIVKLSETELIVLAPFRRALRFPYSEISDIGIDYGSLSVGVQFWIYIGKEKIPAKFCHRINRLPFSKKYVRIQYSPKVFVALRESLPESMRKRFNHCQTTLRVFKQ